MEIGEMMEAIEKGDWGTHIASGKNFYRCLFRKETCTKITKADIDEIFASYKNWYKNTYRMIEECEKNDTAEDRKAISYAKNLNEDIKVHMHRIITTVPFDNELPIETVIQQAANPTMET